MTALAEALHAEQRQAIHTLSKVYVHGADMTTESFLEYLNEIGCTDVVEQSQLLAALDIRRTFGSEAPRQPVTPESRKAPAPMTESQRNRIEMDCKKHSLPLPEDFDVLTKENASRVIRSIEEGNYDPHAFRVPF